MAASITLLNTIAWAQAFVNWADLMVGTGKEPAITSANIALQTIVGPPFVWPWNRASGTFLTTQGTQDYNSSIATFGYLETATLQPAAVITSAALTNNVITYQAINKFSALLQGPKPFTVSVTGCTTSTFNVSQATITRADATSFDVALTNGNIGSETESGALALAGIIYPMELKWGSSGEATEQDRPSFISTQDTSESGVSAVFRLLPVPDQTYQVNLTYQQAPTLFADPGWTWGIPDQFQYIYSYFFLFLILDYFDDPRAARYRQLAVSSLLARQSGLSESDRNLFVGSWLPLVAEEQAKQQFTAQGAQARGL